MMGQMRASCTQCNVAGTFMGIMLSLHCTPTCTVRKWAVQVYTVRALAVVVITVVNACSTILTRTAGTQVQVCAACVSRVACCAHTAEAVQRIDAGASVLAWLTHTVIHQVPTCLPSVPRWTGAGKLPTHTSSTIFATTTAVICCTRGIKPCPYLTDLTISPHRPMLCSLAGPVTACDSV